MRVIVVPSGDLDFKCEFCDHSERLPRTAQASPFWEMFVGNLVLVVIQHEVSRHDVGPKRMQQPATEPLRFGKSPRHERPK